MLLRSGPRPGVVEPVMRPGVVEPDMRPGVVEPGVRPGVVAPVRSRVEVGMLR